MLFTFLSCLALTLSGWASATTKASSHLAPRQTVPAPPGTYLNPEPCYGNCTAWNDNSVLRRNDGKLFRFAVLGGNIYTFTARSWTNPKHGWKFVPGIFLRPNGFVNPVGNQNDFTWTPDVHFINNTYYMFYSDWHPANASIPGDRAAGAISYATSPNMEPGTWTDHGSINIPGHARGAKTYSMIDENVLPYTTPMHMAFGSDDDGIFGVNLTVTSNGTIQAVPADAPEELIVDPFYKGRGLNEGAFQFQYGKYTFLFYQRGECCGTYNGKKTDYNRVYRIYVCRSQSPAGLYYNQMGGSCLSNNGTLFLETHDSVFGPGSVGVHTDPEIGYYIHYQYGNLSVPGGTDLKNLQFGYNYINFSSGWPQLSPTIVPYTGSNPSR